MSMLSKAIRKIGKGAKKLVTDPGEWAKNAGKSVLQAAPYAAGASMIPGVGSLMSRIPGIGGGIKVPKELDMGKVFAGLPGMSGPASAAPSVASVVGKRGIGSQLMGGLRAVGGFARRNPDLILGGLSAAQGFQKGRQADQMMEQAMNDPGLNPMRPDRSDTFSGYSNPYSPAAAAIPSVGMRRRVA